MKPGNNTIKKERERKNKKDWLSDQPYYVITFIMRNGIKLVTFRFILLIESFWFRAKRLSPSKSTNVYNGELLLNLLKLLGVKVHGL